MRKYIYKLTPHFSPKIWGWEKWNLSCHFDGMSVIGNGIYKGRYLFDVIESPEQFPILIKIIDSKSTLSIQVHPDDEYARLHENDNGKTECWYILDAKKDATVILGIHKGLDRISLEKIIDEEKIQNYVNHVSVSKNDFIYIPSGTVHTLEAGIKLIEIQQSSNVTYRLHDWGRGRDLHIKKALDVIDYNGNSSAGKIKNFKHISTPHFTVEKIQINGLYKGFSNSSFHSYTVVSGFGQIQDEYGNHISLETENTVFIPGNMRYTILGSLELLKAYSQD